MRRPIHVGVVGTGAVAQAIHLPTLLRRQDLFEVTALCDISPASLVAAGERCGIGTPDLFDDAAQLVASGRADALLVLTSGSHGDVCRLAADAGLAVFCEKPLAYTVAEADALSALAPRLAVGYMKLYDSAVLRAAEVLAGCPTPRSVEVIVLHPSAHSQLRHVPLVQEAPPAQIRSRLENETDRLLEQAVGPAPAVVKRLYALELLGSVIHDLALVRTLVGEPAACTYVDAWPAADPGSLEILCVLPGDVRLSIRWHYLPDYPAYREELRVHHECGTVEIVFPSPYRPDIPTVLTVVETIDGRAQTTRFESEGSSFEAELVAFHRLAVTGEPTAAGVAEGRKDIVTCQRIIRRLAELRDLPIGGEALVA